MSSTRRVKSGEHRRQNGWASAPEFDVLRGLNGMAVAFKAALQDDPKARELLYALQAHSLREGGLKRIARELVEMFPERIGTSTMLKIGCRPGKRLTRQQHADIKAELYSYDRSFRDLLLDYDDEPKPEPEPSESAAEEFCEKCQSRCESHLHQFIEELCCDPKMEVALERDDSESSSYRGNVEVVLEDARYSLEANPKLARERPDLLTAVESRNQFRPAAVLYFQDVLGALYEYQRRHIERVRAEFVETSISKIVFEAFDYVLETGRTALVEGNSGYGKTTALKTCCEMHPGQARYVQLSGITSRTAFIKRIADACGVANGGGMSTDRIQARVEAFLKRTKLALIIDEGQYLWPQGKRITSHPELVNWLNTALYNEGVPFLISATRQFTLRRQAVEKQTDWSSEQSRRRTRKVFPLPDAPTTKDLRAVARKLLGNVGDLGENAVDLVVGYALTSRGFFQSITDAIDDAGLIAKRAGRDRITFKDLKTAIYEWRAQSDAALQRVYDTKAESRRRGPTPVPSPPQTEMDEPEVNEPLIAPSRGLRVRLNNPPPGHRQTLPDAGAVLTG